MTTLLSIGDIHGKDTWKNFLFGSVDTFNELFQSESTEWAHIDYWDSVDSAPTILRYDKIIFIGDYVDSFTIASDSILKNLQDLIACKRLFPDKIILLLGNHDIQYITGRYCSGFRAEMETDLKELFHLHADLFQLAYEHEFKHEFKGSNKFIWTHAGVTQQWYDEFIFWCKANTALDLDNESANLSLSEQLNIAWKYKIPSLFSVDSISGGRDEWAGPVWVRPGFLSNFAITGYNQVVGHTPKGTVELRVSSKGTSLYFIDTLEHGDATTLTLYDI